MKTGEPIKLKRGQTDIVLKKLSDRFAVRLKKGKAKDVSMFRVSNVKLDGEPRHIDSAHLDNMEIFSVEESKMEKMVNDLRTVPQTDVVTHMYASDDSPDGAFIPTGTMTIQFSPDVKNSEREKILKSHGLQIDRELDYLPHGYIVKLTTASTQNPLKIAFSLQGRKEILIAEPDLSFKVSYKYIPDDTLYSQQWHLNNTGNSAGLLAGADVKAEAAWDITLGSRDIRICIMDDGFDLLHPDFNVQGKIVAPRDFGESDTDPSPALSDDNHGTSCAGVALAVQNGTGVVGLAPRCSFMPVRTSGWLSDESIEELFQYAIDNFADVISCSWAASAAYFPLSTRMNGIIHKAATQGRNNGKGCVILFAAGNESAPLNGQGYYQGFALHPDVIAVAASNSLDEQSYYSNFGPEITICAPSSGSPGRGIVTTDRRGINGYGPEDYTYSFGGTSSSTPLCAGLAGLILSVDPELTYADVREIIKNTADKIDAVNGQYDANGHSSKYGHGRINAKAALEMASGSSPVEKSVKTLYMEHRVKTPIPDMGEITDTIPFPMPINVRAFELSIDIKHTYRGDLSIYLQPPGQAEITLLNRTGGAADDFVKTFRSSDEPILFQGLIDKPARGDWKIRIKDNAQRDDGVLDKWGIAIMY
ncbi:MAG: S8 family serine peptidase [Bacteroidales bacterium]|nr:S8 family serine peptidase [Bacteroidales bacterium]